MSEIETLRRKVEKLEHLASAAYASLGAEHDLPEYWLDILAAAAGGQDFDLETIPAGYQSTQRLELERLQRLINEPQAGDFLRAVSMEAEHQRQRWGSEHDSGRQAADWFWLVGYLAGKALHAQLGGKKDKAEHHIITTAAALANWHLALTGENKMRPGIAPPT